MTILRNNGGEIIANDRGGKQSKIEGRGTEIPPLALLEVSKVMGLGAEKYPREEDGTPNWYKIGCMSNLDHAMEHLFNFLFSRNEVPEDGAELAYQRRFRREELGHVAARVMMGLEQFLRGDM